MLTSLHNRLWRRAASTPARFEPTSMTGAPFRPDWDSTIYFRDRRRSVATAETVSREGTVLRLGHFAVGTESVGRGAGKVALLSLAAYLEAQAPDITSIDLDMGRQPFHVDPDRLRDARVALLQWLAVAPDQIYVSPKLGIHAGQWRVQGRWDQAHWQAQRLPQVWATYRAGATP